MTSTLTMIDLDTTVTTTEALAVADLGGESVVLDPASGRYYGLNEVAARIVQLAAGSARLGDIVEQILTEYDVEREQLARDVQSFVSDLASKGLIQLR